MSMTRNCESEYEWSASRKLWHLVGCLLMVSILYLWKDIRWPFSGGNVLILLAWMETGLAFSIDIIRFYSPRQNDAVKALPFYGKLMRPIEESHFNATTYYLFAAAILISAYRVGWCRESTFVISLIVLGVADPAAAWARYQFHKRGLGQEKAVGLLAFLVASSLIMLLTRRWLACDLSLKCILGIGLIVAVIESYTKYWVMLIRPVTRRVQRLITHQATLWLLRLYPDDNLLIPLAVAVLAGILPYLT